MVDFSRGELFKSYPPGKETPATTLITTVDVFSRTALNRSAVSEAAAEVDSHLILSSFAKLNEEEAAEPFFPASLSMDLYELHLKFRVIFRFHIMKLY